MKTTKWKFGVAKDVQAMVENAVQTMDYSDELHCMNSFHETGVLAMDSKVRGVPTLSERRKTHLDKVRNELINYCLRLHLAPRKTV